MSTTNPPGGNQPGAGPNWPADVRHGQAPDDHGGGGGVNPEAIRAGHEPDVFAVKPIMSIPAAVLIAFAVAFAVAAGAFFYFKGVAARPDPLADPQAVARSETPLNDRLQWTDRAGSQKDPLREVDQPRLEPLRLLEADGLFYSRPPLPYGNSPEIHWEDIRPDRVEALQKYGTVHGPDGKPLNGPDGKPLVHLPIAEAMKLAAADKAMFPVQKTPSKPIPSGERPSAASAGIGIDPPLPAEAPKPPEGKKDEKKEPTPAPKPPEKKQ